MRVARFFFRFGEGYLEKQNKRKNLNGPRGQFGYAGQDFIPQTIPADVGLKNSTGFTTLLL